MMNQQEFIERKPGQWVKNTEGGITFMPAPLPRTTNWLAPLSALIAESAQAVGVLKGILQQDGLNTGLILRPLASREAALSSKIEGTVAAERELALFEVTPKVEEEATDVREVSNYLSALEWGAKASTELPISPAFIRRLHEMLMAGVRGGDATPGAFRKKQVLIGGDGSYATAKFVPPPFIHVEALVEDVVRFMDEARELPPLVRAALTHYQFETIHPFGDGNGRVGRLLIAIQVVRDFQLDNPALHMSAYFEADRQAYYDGLLNLSKTGNFAEWTAYFLKGVIRQAKDTVARMGQLRALRRDYRSKFENARGSVLTSKAIDYLFQKPAVSVRLLAEHLGVTDAAARQHVGKLQAAGIIAEVTGQNYGRIYLATQILRVAQNPLEASAETGR